MTYVFDNSPLSALFKSYYRNIFKSLWEGFDSLVDNGQILSTREVFREMYPFGETRLGIRVNTRDSGLEWAGEE